MSLVVWALLVAAAHLARTALSKPPPPPRPACDDCGARFLSPLGVDLHRRAAHPDTFDGRRVVPAEYRTEEGT